MVHTTPVTKSQNTTQDGKLRCIIVSSVNQTKQPQLRYEDPWPIILYGPWLCVLFQHDAPKSSILGSFLASSFQHYLCDWRLFCSVTPSYTTWRKVELPFQTMWVWRFLHPTNFPPLFLTGELRLGDLWTGEDADPKWERQEDRDARGLEGSGKKCTFSSH